MQESFKDNFWKIDRGVFFGAVAFICVLVFFTLTNLENAEHFFKGIKFQTTNNFGWFFIISVQVFLVICLYMAFGRFAKVRLGGPGCRPDYHVVTWFAMLFASGMGIGLMFFSVAEPIMHFNAPPIYERHSMEAAQNALDLTFLHWGFRGWCVYALVGLTIAYKSYNHHLPLNIRSSFYSLLGEKLVDGWPGRCIDILAVVATLFGVATSLGFGANQISAGLEHVFGFDSTRNTSLAIIGFITVIATISVVSGLNKGIRILSIINIIGAAILLTFVVLFGPTLFILNSAGENFGDYLNNIIHLASWNNAFDPDNQWQDNWTIFYWAWWLAWSPFVGLFIARISKGRTIQQFVLGVLIVPTLITCFWINAFGGTALFMELFGDGCCTEAVEANHATAIYVLLEQLPLAEITPYIAVVMVIIFFITSSDSGSYVIDMICSGGNPNPPVQQRMFWASTEGIVAAVLMFSGGLAALQAGTVSAGLPFGVLVWLMIISLFKALNEDYPAAKDPLPLNKGA